jgi:hypothetical protein
MIGQTNKCQKQHIPKSLQRGTPSDFLMTLKMVQKCGLQWKWEERTSQWGHLTILPSQMTQANITVTNHVDSGSPSCDVMK